MVKTGDCSSLRLPPSAGGPRSGFSKRPAPRPVCRATLGVNLLLAFLRSQPKFSPTPAFAWATPLGLNEGGEKPAPFTKTVKDVAPRHSSSPESLRVARSVRIVSRSCYCELACLLCARGNRDPRIAVRSNRKKALIRNSDQGPLVSTAD